MYFSHLAHSLTNSWVPKIAPPFSFAQRELTPVTEAKSAPGSQRHSGKAQPPPQGSWGSPCPAERMEHTLRAFRAPGGLLATCVQASFPASGPQLTHSP